MSLNRIHRNLIVLSFALAGTCNVFGADADSPKTDDITRVESQSTAELTLAEIGRWKFQRADDESKELKLVKTPILRWTNPSVGRVYGSVYVITEDGRPQAIVSPYKWFEPHTGFEMECRSLASTGLNAYRDNKSVWSTSKPGMEWKAIPNPPDVGKTTVERQRQIKQLAEEFTAQLLDTRDQERGDDQQLRQMTQPVYRYSSPSHHVLDGAVFAYVVGTDPELFLNLEAREVNGEPQWQYGLARMNSDRLVVKFRGDEVWQVDKLSLIDLRDGKQPYFCFLVQTK